MLLDHESLQALPNVATPDRVNVDAIAEGRAAGPFGGKSPVLLGLLLKPSFAA